MSDLFTRFAALLRELDEVVPLNQPVPISPLIGLVKQHAKLETVTLVGVTAERLEGFHGGKTDSHALVIYQRCERHPDPKHSDRGCPGCQTARFDIAKELTHSLDGAHERTSPDDSADKLLALVVKQAWEGPEAAADGFGAMCALELLVRFRTRTAMLGSPAVAPSLRLTMAKNNNNYSELASQFAVPHWLLQHAFSEPYTNAIKNWRIARDLPLIPPDWE